MGENGDLNVAGLAVPITLQADVLEDKSRKMLNGVQKGLNLQLHRWSLAGWFVFSINSQTNPTQKDQRCLFNRHYPARRFELKRATGRAFEPPARARLRSNVSTRLTGTPLLPTNHATDPIFDDRAEYYFANEIGGQIITFPVQFDKENGVWKILEF
jgi:hypothetical protein